VPEALRYDPFSIRPDGLHIKADLLTSDQQAAYHIGGFRRFGSGMLLSRSVFTYAKIRMVAKLPSARGSWPALWLLPESHQWPPEIDIFEGMAWGSHNQQIHTALLVPKGEPGAHLEWTELHMDPSKDFHEYGLDWTADTVAVLFDGKVLWRYPTPSSMHQAMYLIVNLAVGGKWPFNELHVQPTDSMNPDRLTAGANLIQSDYPAEMIVKSITITTI
jgi:beta-glucanase (GH16 family)